MTANSIKYFSESFCLLFLSCFPFVLQNACADENNSHLAPPGADEAGISSGTSMGKTGNSANDVMMDIIARSIQIKNQRINERGDLVKYYQGVLSGLRSKYGLDPDDGDLNIPEFNNVKSRITQLQSENASDRADVEKQSALLQDLRNTLASGPPPPTEHVEAPPTETVDRPHTDFQEGQDLAQGEAAAGAGNVGEPVRDSGGGGGSSDSGSGSGGGSSGGGGSSCGGGGPCM